MLDKTADGFEKLLTWVFDKLGYVFVLTIVKSSKKDYSKLFKYQKIIGFVIVGLIVLIIFLITKK